MVTLMVAGGAAAEDSPTPPDAASRFAVFDLDLRQALARRDAPALALLVQFPLRLNRADGSTLALESPRTLQAELDLAFPPAVRDSILATRPDELIWKAAGVGYREGIAWAELIDEDGEERYRLKVVNYPLGGAPPPPAAGPRLEFVCNARSHRIVIESVGEAPRFRAWARSRTLAEAPDFDIQGGTRIDEGTSPCNHSIWKFASDGSTYTVSQLGCGPGDEPAGAIGEIVVNLAPDREVRSWCF
jgi:hypothetical protein